MSRSQTKEMTAPFSRSRLTFGMRSPKLGLSRLRTDSLLSGGLKTFQLESTLSR